MNPPETIPKDPYIESRKKTTELKSYKTKTDYDKLKQYIDMDRKVLRFYVVWDDRKSSYGELRPFIIQYYLVNDTLEVREVHKPNDGRDPFPIMIKRQRVPRDRNNVKSNYKPHHFAMGQSVNIFGRNFTIYDMDNFTKAFYYQNFGVSDFSPLNDENSMLNKNTPHPRMVIIYII